MVRFFIYLHFLSKMILLDCRYIHCTALIKNEHFNIRNEHCCVIGYCEGRGTPITARKSQSECVMLATPSLQGAKTGLACML